MKNEIFYTTINSPIGFLKISTDNSSLLSIEFIEEIEEYENSSKQPQILKETVNQLNQYFKGKLQEFNLKLAPKGSEFQQKIWQLVQKVEYGKTTSYLDIAIQSGSNKNTRAVGLANGKNPIPIIIPCHRVLGKNGKLTGYAGGLERKKWLLLFELNNSKNTNLLF